MLRKHAVGFFGRTVRPEIRHQRWVVAPGCSSGSVDASKPGRYIHRLFGKPTKLVGTL